MRSVTPKQAASEAVALALVLQEHCARNTNEYENEYHGTRRMTSDVVMTIYVKARIYARLCEVDANGLLTPYQQGRMNGIKRTLATIAKEHFHTEVSFRFGGDPRGYTVSIVGPSIPRNGWGDGYGIA